MRRTSGRGPGGASRRTHPAPGHGRGHIPKIKAESSNASSNVNTQDRIGSDYLERVDADHPKDRTTSHGVDTDRACLLIRGSPRYET